MHKLAGATFDKLLAACRGTSIPHPLAYMNLASAIGLSEKMRKRSIEALQRLYKKAGMATAIGGLADDAVIVAYKATQGKKQKGGKPVEASPIN